MTDVAVFSSAHPLGEPESAVWDDTTGATPSGSVAVKWAPEAATSPLGLAAFCIEFLPTTGLRQSLIDRCPVQRTSPNAPSNTTAIGRLLLTMLSGGNRYRHSEALRGDRVTPELLGMERMLSVFLMRFAFCCSGSRCTGTVVDRRFTARNVGIS